MGLVPSWHNEIPLELSERYSNDVLLEHHEELKQIRAENVKLRAALELFCELFDADRILPSDMQQTAKEIRDMLNACR